MSYSYVCRGALRAWHAVAVEADVRVVPHAVCGAAPPAGRAWPEARPRREPGMRVCRHCLAILRALGETP